MREELRGTINKIKLLIETDVNMGIDEYYLMNNDSRALKVRRLEELRGEVLKCRKCALSKTRNNVVFGEGDPDADLLFVGEAPGRDEDLAGRPFVGRAGKLLTKIINAMGLTREKVFIANILKDRPPANRNPKEEEINACRGYLLRQIEIIEPKVICALGTFAAQVLLGVDTPISKLRGKFYDYHNVKFMPTYHPAYLLRNPGGKKPVWEDMKKIMKELGIKNNDSSSRS